MSDELLMQFAQLHGISKESAQGYLREYILNSSPAFAEFQSTTLKSGAYMPKQNLLTTEQIDQIKNSIKQVLNDALLEYGPVARDANLAIFPHIVNAAEAATVETLLVAWGGNQSAVATVGGLNRATVRAIISRNQIGGANTIISIDETLSGKEKLAIGIAAQKAMIAAVLNPIIEAGGSVDDMLGHLVALAKPLLTKTKDTNTNATIH